MREAFHERLDDVSSRLVDMAGLTASLTERAGQALLAADLELAETVVADDSALDQAQDDADQLILALMALQQPVAGDLRQIVSAMRITADLERMGDLATHVAKVARMRYPEQAVPADLRETFASMAALATTMTRQAERAMRERDVALCEEIKHDDEAMNELHRSLFATMLRDDWDGTVEQAVDLALLGRYFERLADHAVLIAAHVAFLVSGDYARLTGDAPR